MLYQWYELGHAAVKPARAAADSYRLFFESPFNPIAHTSVGRSAAAACQVFERTTRQYEKPSFGLASTIVDGTIVPVREEIVWQRPFCKLIHFKREIAEDQCDSAPRVLLVAPMSGHYATLLRGTVEALLPDHDVYITDWQDAGEVSLAAGRFDLDDYIDYMRDMFRFFDGDVHVTAVCQPSVPVLAAVALMEADDERSVPVSMVLMGGPIDTRISKTKVNEFAEGRKITWFARNVIVSVPWSNRGFGRKVYPGFLQLSGFMSMNLNRHVNAHKDMFFHLVDGDGDSAEKHRDFYDEYLAVMDLTKEFYLQTIDKVFLRHELPRGVMRHRGRLIDLNAIRRVALMTVEGEKDDITGRGQCAAAIGLCGNLDASKKQHFECPSVGHYGIFNGRRFRNEITPRLAHFYRQHDKSDKRKTAAPWLSLVTAANEDNDASTTSMPSPAFTFAPSASCRIDNESGIPAARELQPANDSAPDPVAERVKASGLEAIRASRRDSTRHAIAMQTATFDLWRLASIGALRYASALMRLKASANNRRPSAPADRELRVRLRHKS